MFSDVQRLLNAQCYTNYVKYMLETSEKIKLYHHLSSSSLNVNIKREMCTSSSISSIIKTRVEILA